MRYVCKRLALYAVAAWAAVTLGFVLPRLMPGDPATALLARLRGKLSPASLALGSTRLQFLAPPCTTCGLWDVLGR